MNVHHHVRFFAVTSVTMSRDQEMIWSGLKCLLCNSHEIHLEHSLQYCALSSLLNLIYRRQEWHSPQRVSLDVSVFIYSNQNRLSGIFQFRQSVSLFLSVSFIVKPTIDIIFPSFTSSLNLKSTSTFVLRSLADWWQVNLGDWQST